MLGLILDSSNDDADFANINVHKVLPTVEDPEKKLCCLVFTASRPSICLETSLTAHLSVDDGGLSDKTSCCIHQTMSTLPSAV